MVDLSEQFQTSVGVCLCARACVRPVVCPCIAYTFAWPRVRYIHIWTLTQAIENIGYIMYTHMRTFVSSPSLPTHLSSLPYYQLLTSYFPDDGYVTAHRNDQIRAHRYPN